MNPTNQPIHIKRAVISIIFALVVSFIKLGIDYDYISAVAPIKFTIIGLVFTVLILMFLAYKIWTGRNWARIIFTVFFVIGIYPALLLLPLEADRNVVVLLASILQILLQIVAIIYMFLPLSNAWFKSIKQAKSA